MEIVQLKFIKNSMVIEDVYVDDVGPLKFLVTTDSPTTILDRGLAERLGLKLSGPYEGVGAGGEVLGYMTNVGSLKIGKISLENLQVSVIDFSQISDRLGFKVSGAIASDILKKCRALIDYGAAQLKLCKTA